MIRRGWNCCRRPDLYTSTCSPRRGCVPQPTNTGGPMTSLGRFRAFAGAMLLTAVGASGGQAGNCALPAWMPAPQVGNDVYGPAVTSAGGFVYAASGYSVSLGGWVNQFRRYDPMTNAWT